MGGFATSSILEVRGERMVKRPFSPGFRIAPYREALAPNGARQLQMALPTT